ncbi:MAG: hypothetical protein U5K79_04055 [Cyclobacteriaceae bacterium]|nr:hypothetical protein [Cyclobacteriaceae bacterium]
MAIYNQPDDIIKPISNPNTSCDAKSPVGSLSVSVNGDITNFKLWWYQGSTVKTTPDFVGPNYLKLPAGNYLLEVADLKNTPLITMTSAITDDPVKSADTIEIILILPQTSCTASNGKLEDNY